MKQTTLGIALSIALVGCSSMAPLAPTADSNVPGQWSNINQAIQIQIPHWSQVFTSPIIQEDLRLALANNKEIKQASLNALKAHQLIKAVEGLLTISASANSESTGDFFPHCCISNHDEYGALSLDYEIDLWGRIRSSQDSAQFNAEAADFTLEAVQSAIQSDVIRSHLIIAYVNEYNAVLDELDKVLNHLTHQAKARSDSGLPNSAELSRLLLKKSSILSIRNQLGQQRANAVDGLRILTSYTRDDGRFAKTVSEITAHYSGIPSNASSEILLSRPDVKSAERKMLAANADIGVASAERFPRIAISFDAFFFPAGKHVWKAFPFITQVLFDGGRLKAREDAAVTNRDITLVQYEIAIQRAYRDTANALSASQTTERQVDLANQAQALSQQAFNRTMKRVDAGYDSLSDLIDRFEELSNANSQIPKSHFDHAINNVALLTAVGTRP